MVSNRSFIPNGTDEFITIIHSTGEHMLKLGPKKTSCLTLTCSEAALRGAAFFLDHSEDGSLLPYRGQALEAAIAELERAADEARWDWFDRRERPEADALFRLFLRRAEALTDGLHLLGIQSFSPPSKYR